MYELPWDRAGSARSVECISYAPYYVSSWSQVYIFTFRFIFENLMFCIDMTWYLWIGYAIGMIQFYLTNNKLLYLIYSDLFWNIYIFLVD